jgi:CDP-glucose 4,6-dehydratase
MNVEFWRRRKVLITGHTGFKGSWLCLWLHRLGARVYGYSLPPPTNPSLYEQGAIGEVVDSITGDVREGPMVAAQIARIEPDVILHLAARSVVLEAYADPVETFSTNVVGTASVLNAVRGLRGKCAVVNVTTDKVYENRGWVWGYREDDILGGRDPYSSSKACAELVAGAFRQSYFSGDGQDGCQIGLTSARAGNVIGGGDWTPHQLIPDTIAALAKGEPVILRNPGAIRPWQHVLDCLSGYLTLAEALYRDPKEFAGGWNFGPTDADMQPVSRVVELLAAPWGVRQAWIRDTAAYSHESMELRLNSQKAERVLAWRGRLPLKTALEWTSDWFRQHFAGASARALCLSQIDDYMKLALVTDQTAPVNRHDSSTIMLNLCSTTKEPKHG